MICTSPPYWGLRDYGSPLQLGLERTPEEYVARLVRILGEYRRPLAKDGTLWLNLGDSYSAFLERRPTTRETWMQRVGVGRHGRPGSAQHTVATAMN